MPSFNSQPLINEIEELVEQIDGWTPIDQLYTLYILARSTEYLEGNILEIGSWCGRSTVVLAKAASMKNGTIVNAVDLFPSKDDWTQNPDGSYSFRVNFSESLDISGYQEQTVWKEPFDKDIAPIYERFDSLFDLFEQNINKAGFSNIVRPFKNDSRVVGTQIQEKIRFAFIDADHSYEAVVTDIEKTEKLLVPGAYICFDDAFSHYEGVNEAIKDKIINSKKYCNCQQMTRKLFVAQYSDNED